MTTSRKWGIIALAALGVLSCGTVRQAPSVHTDAPVILPLTDSADIARSRERAKVVMDSSALVQSGAKSTAADKGIVTSTGVKPVPTPPRELVDEMLDYAKSFIGVPYRLGASGPDLFDCSGFTSYVFRAYGYELPHSSAAQFKQCRPVEEFIDLQKGDLVFFGARNSIRNIGHVGIVVDIDERHGMFHFIHASTSHGVEVQRSTQPYFMMRHIGAGRILPDNI